MSKAVKKKVLFTSHVANFQKFNRPFMRMLSEQGWEVHYASDGEEKILDTDKEFTIPFERSPFKLGNIKAYFKLKKIIDHEKYDMIHTHTPMGSVVTRLAARHARKNGTRVIYTAHGFHFFKGAPIANWLIYYPIEKFMARHTDTLITINNEDFERAKAKFRTDVQYVPGVGIDPKKFDVKMSKVEKNTLRKSLGLKDSDFVLLYPAELNKNKNQAMLINVMESLTRKHPNVHLLLPGKDSLNGFHKSLVDKKHLSKNIHFLGYRNDIPQLLKITDISVSTSRREGLPVNIMEAVYLGIPVVATACRGNKDLVKDGLSGRVAPVDDLAVFLSSLEQVITDVKTYKKNAVTHKSFSSKSLLASVSRRLGSIYQVQKGLDTHYKKSCVFVHDFKYIEYENKIYGDGQFEYNNLWKKKYLSIFDSLTVVARGRYGTTRTDVESKYRLDGKGVSFVMTDSFSSLKRLFHMPSAGRILKKEISKADVAIVRLPSIQGLIACGILRKMKKSYIVEVVGSSFDSLWYHDRIKGKLAAIPLQLLTKYAIKKAQNVIYVTNNYLQRQYPTAGSVLACSDVIIDSIEQKALDKRLKRIEGYNPDTVFKLGLVGSYDVMYKGHDIAIRAVSQISKLHKVELHFLGSGNKNYWIEYASQYGVNDSLIFDNPVSAGAQMQDWLDSQDVLLVPSKTEGMPRVLLEGLSRASLIIGTAVGDIPSVIQSRFVIQKHDYSGLANLVLDLISDKKTMNETASENFEKANDFLLANLTEKRVSFIDKAISRGRY